MAVEDEVEERGEDVDDDERLGRRAKAYAHRNALKEMEEENDGFFEGIT